MSYKQYNRNIYGLVAVIALLVLPLVSGAVFTTAFFSGTNWGNIVQQASVPVLLALGGILTARAEGVDVTGPGLMGVSALLIARYGAAGLGLGLLACAGLGLLQGLLVVRVKVPSLAYGMVVLEALKRLCQTVSGGMVVPLEREGILALNPRAVLPLLLLLGLMAALAYGAATPLRKNVDMQGRREGAERAFVASYGLSGLLAGLAGAGMLLRLGVYNPMMGMGYELELLCAVFFAGACRFFDGGVKGVLVAVAGAFALAMGRNVMSLLGMNPYAITVLGMVTLLVLLAVNQVYAAKGQWWMVLLLIAGSSTLRGMFVLMVPLGSDYVMGAAWLSRMLGWLPLIAGPFIIALNAVKGLGLGRVLPEERENAWEVMAET